MTVEAVELHRVGMPLVRPFVTSHGSQRERDVLLVHVLTDVGDGWGECVAMSDPVYSSEYVDAAEAVLRDYLVPALFAAPDTTAEGFGDLVAFVVGHRMAKAALETALLDAELRARGISFATYFGAVRDRVDCGVSVGIATSIDALLEEVAGYRAAGYQRITLNIRPGWDLEPVAAVRELLGPEVMLQVDANGSYRAADIRHVARLDAFDLLLVEQPFPEEDIPSHILLADEMETPLCLDESILSAAVAADAIERGATSIVNVKAGRLGGYHEAVRVHDVCAELGVAVWCGGMLETGIGRAVNVALSAMENFLLPGDTSASERYFPEDITEPFVLRNGQLDVPAGPGSGVEVNPDLLRAFALGAPLVLHTTGD
jgi:O-succinylbenzoate synthase